MTAVWSERERAMAEEVGESIGRQTANVALSALDHWGSLYPNVPALLATLPVTTAEAERLFSKLEQTLVTIRSTMDEKRSETLLRLQVHKAHTPSIGLHPSIDAVIDKFATTSASRLNFVLMLSTYHISLRYFNHSTPSQLYLCVTMFAPNCTIKAIKTMRSAFKWSLCRSSQEHGAVTQSRWARGKLNTGDIWVTKCLRRNICKAYIFLVWLN